MRSKITVIVAALFALAACGSPDALTTTTGAGSAASTTVATSDSGGVSTAESPLGTILVDPDGLTLYVFTPDNGGASTCYQQCAVLWPPVPANTKIGSGVDASMFGTTTRSDGTGQLTVNGWPLYVFTSDGGPGEVNGQGVEGVWFVIDAAGEMIETPGGPGTGSDSTVPDYDYGY